MKVGRTTWDAMDGPKGFTGKGAWGLDMARTFEMRGGSDNAVDKDDRCRGNNNAGPRHG